MNRHIDDIVILVDNLDHLLHLPIRRHTHQTTELTHTMIDMYHIVANLELLYLLQRQSHLSPTGLVALKAILMIAVKQLMIREVALLHCVIYEALMDGCRNRRERNQRISLAVCIEDILQSPDLFIVICKNMNGIAFADESFELTRHQFEVLMEQRLHTCIERHLQVPLPFAFGHFSYLHLTQSCHILLKFLTRRQETCI